MFLAMEPTQDLVQKLPWGCKVNCAPWWDLTTSDAVDGQNLAVLTTLHIFPKPGRDDFVTNLGDAVYIC